MIHHLSLGTNDVRRGRGFYDPVLAVIGLRLIHQSDRSADFGTGDVLLSLEKPFDQRPASPGNGVHVAFRAKDRAMVHAFHETALAHGGTDHGAPGRRPECNANYYGAFVRDPDATNIEAVTCSAK